MIIKYWKGKIGSNKENQYGTMDDNGYVPDSIIISKYQYDNYVNSLPVIPVIDEKIEFSKLANDTKKIEYIAKKLKLM